MSIYDDALPELVLGDKLSIVKDGHAFEITPTTKTGWNTGRRRYRVFCTTCDEEVHAATTGPEQQASIHIWEQKDA